MRMAVKQITPLELKARLAAPESVTLIDVREQFETEIASLGGALIPSGEVVERQAEIPRAGTVVIYCRSGGRSTKAIEELEKRFGFDNLYNLAGGILRWADDVDPTMEKY